MIGGSCKCRFLFLALGSCLTCVCVYFVALCFSSRFSTNKLITDSSIDYNSFMPAHADGKAASFALGL